MAGLCRANDEAAGFLCGDAGSECVVQDTCDGSGTCLDGGHGDCSPYVCNTTACRTTCSDNAHCVAGYFCSSGACITKKPIGQTCLNGVECQTNNCIDGYCCDTPCTGFCRSCALAAWNRHPRLRRRRRP